MHYGDSQIEMDRMSDRLRTYMQDHFGGGGPGMVPFATLIPSYSVSTYGSGNLVRQSPFGDSIVVRANGNYGPMVQDFRVEGAAYSSITATTHRNRDARLRQFSRFKLIFCNRPGPLKAVFSDRAVSTPSAGRSIRLSHPCASPSAVPPTSTAYSLTTAPAWQWTTYPCAAAPATSSLKSTATSWPKPTD